MTEDRLKAFGDAWSRGDVDTLMTFMTENCKFSASVGPEPGRTYVGREAVRRGFEDILAFDAGSPSIEGDVFIAGDRGASEWAVSKTDQAGNRVLVRGCDLFEFEGDLIRHKDAFRKTYPS